MIVKPPSFLLVALRIACNGGFLAAVILPVVFLVGPVRAQSSSSSTGTISGQVLDATSGKYLEGAEVSVEAVGQALRATTERGGKFTIPHIPAGERNLVISYPGLEIATRSVVVRAGRTVDVPVTLNAEILVLDAMTVSSAKEGMAQAQALQKASIQFKIVAANDQFGSVSEGNIGEYLKFLPGVGIDYNSNDARGVSLRGLRTQFTIVAVDGTPMASGASGGDSRRFELEQIAMSNVETTEVYKTLTPDLPADATGGFINMVTKSAFDRKDVSLFTYDVSFLVPSTRVDFGRKTGTWGNGSHILVRPNAEVNYARRVTEKIGFNLNYRLSEIYHDSPRSEYTWDYGGVGLSVGNPTLRQFNQNNEQKLTHREAVASKLDFQLAERTRLTVSGQWNWYDLTFTQRSIQYLLGPGESQVNLPGADSAVSGPGASVSNITAQRNKYGTTLHGNVTLTHEFADRSRACFTAYVSKASSKYRDANKGFFAQYQATYTPTPAISATHLLGKTTHPEFALSVADAQLRDLTNYSLNLNTLQVRPDTAHDAKRGINGHYSHILDVRMPVTLQAGAALDVTERDINRRNYRPAAGTISGEALEKFKADYRFDYDYDFGAGEVLNLYKLYDAYGSNLVLNTFDVRRFEEKNIAAYARFDVRPVKDLLLIGGVRWEGREIEGSTQSLTTARSLPGRVKLDYGRWYPSFLAKYEPSFAKSWVFRGGAGRTVGHPDYAELLSTFQAPTAAGANDGTITVADPHLKPYFVKNYDLSAQYYFARSAAFGVAVFRKEVDGFVISRSLANDSPDADAVIRAFGLDPADYRSAQVRTNGRVSTLEGLEVMYNQTFDFLPKPFNGLSLQANYTKIDVDGDDLDTQYAQALSAVTESANLIIGYRFRSFNVTASNNWTDDVLITGPATQGAGTNAATMVTYKAPEFKTTIQLQYAVGRGFSVYVEARNLFYERKEFLQGYLPEDQSINLPGRVLKYGDPIYVLGLKGSF